MKLITEKQHIKTILEKAEKYQWSIQGFGFLRMYLTADEVYRLHIWDDRYKIPNVSIIHTHPWDFCSKVYSGQIYNTRYKAKKHKKNTHFRLRIVTGENAKPAANIKVCKLAIAKTDSVKSGENYFQRADEIHETQAKSGTVTVIRRQFLDDRSKADVFFPIGTDWVDARPRPATEEEVKDITENALKNWE